MKFTTQAVIVEIEKDVMTKFVKGICIHEIPILQMIHGDAAVQPQDYGDQFEMDTQEEFDRLANKYGEDTESKMSFVERVYGMSGRGLVTTEDLVQEKTKDIPIDLKRLNPDDEDGVETKQPKVLADPPPDTDAVPLAEREIGELREMCDDQSIEYNKTDNRATLAKRITDLKAVA